MHLLNGVPAAVPSEKRSLLSLLSFVMFAEIVACFCVDQQITVFILHALQGLTVFRLAISEVPVANVSAVTAAVMASNIPIVLTHLTMTEKRRGLLLSFVNAGITYSVWDALTLDVVILCVQYMVISTKSGFVAAESSVSDDEETGDAQTLS
jgi:hypothetical protein